LVQEATRERLLDIKKRYGFLALKNGLKSRSRRKVGGQGGVAGGRGRYPYKDNSSRLRDKG
jgi:hypothetical protein